MTNFNAFIDLIFSIRDRDLLEDVLIGATTPKERDELARRIEIIKKLINKEPQHKIACDLGVGIATVTRGSKELTEGRFKVLKNPL